MIKKIGVLTGGGDSPAINAATKAIFLKASQYGYKVMGIKNGWEGMIKGNMTELDRESVSGILAEGGTILGTSRTNPFKIENGVEKIKENMAKFELDAIITIGGDDTNGAITRLTQYGIKGVGIPQTIDNDIAHSDYAIGYASALEVVTDCIDKLHTTANSHHRIMVVEIMGRDSGCLALNGGIAGGADIILIPEVPFDYGEIINVIEERKERGQDFCIIVVAEGAKPAEVEGQVSSSDEIDSFGHVRLGGVANVIAKEIEKRTGYGTRATILGHLQRGGRPSAFDRIVGIRLGVKAVELIHEGKFGEMAVIENGAVTSVPLEKAIKEEKPLDMELFEISKLLH
ncbi:pyrophosphate--fructose-6-phosphate 1-phosphotransferase [Candidatus Atribacteria bacterium RBG_16_35_8]|nr:MAG: pyrophosphate--fructose-6-phosphate 1-phosphotransferase [Candidatus Atribacteria bacterium RBG_16_35_8]